MSYFFSFEGLDGVGKTSIIERLGLWLDQQGQSYVATREPGGSPVAEEIRMLLMKPELHQAQAITQTLMMFAARHEHLIQTIQPALRQGLWVLTDRFTDSTYAYQGGIAGVDHRLIDKLAKQIHAEYWPVKTFWLDVPLDLVTGRILSKGSQNYFDDFNRSSQEKLREVFEQRYQANPERIIRIDASQDLVTVSEQIIGFLKPYLNQ